MNFAGLRIAFVGPIPPPAGGMANLTQQLVALLRSEGATVHLVPTNAPYRPAAVATIPVLRAIFRLFPYLAALWNVAGRVDLMHVMANSGWSWHLFAAPAIWIAHLRGTPVLVNYHGGEAARFLGKSRPLVALSMRRARLLAVPSGYLQSVFAGFGMAAQVLPNLVDLARFQPRTNTESGLRLVVTRNLEPVYDNETALKAFALIRRDYADATMTIAGSGPEAGRLHELAGALGVAEAVRFAGRLDSEGMARLYREADIMVNPSRVDNMPVSILEAWATGVPVVSTDVGGIPFLVDHGRTGWLVPPGSPDAMAAGIRHVLADANLRAALAAEGRREVERYTWPRIAPVLASLYQQVTGARTAPLGA